MRYTPDTSGMDSRLKKNLEDISRVLAKQGATPPATSNQASSGSAAGMTLASSVIVAPAGGIASTNVQSALQELDTEKLPTTATMDAIAQGTTSKKLSATEYTDLTDAGDSALHYHASDRNRANHTGTQTASTISDFASTVRATLLTGLSLATGGVISIADSILGGLGKLQNQLTALTTTVSGKQDSVSTVTGAYSATGSWLKLIGIVLPSSASATANWSISIFESGNSIARSHQTGILNLAWRNGTLDAEYIQFNGSGGTLSFGYKGSIALNGTLQVYAITGDATPTISMRIDKDYGGFEGSTNSWTTTNPTITTAITTNNMSVFEKSLQLSGRTAQVVAGQINADVMIAPVMSTDDFDCDRLKFNGNNVTTTQTKNVTGLSSIILSNGVACTLSGGTPGQMVCVSCQTSGASSTVKYYRHSGDSAGETRGVSSCFVVLLMCHTSGYFGAT